MPETVKRLTGRKTRDKGQPLSAPRPFPGLTPRFIGLFLLIIGGALAVGLLVMSANNSTTPFDADRAMDYLREICKIGPRISGSPGMKKQQEFLKKHFESLGGKVSLQSFTARQVSQPNQPVSMANMIVTWHPERNRRVILCAHYDTRPIADQEEDPRKWREPFLSANDGGSGVAFLMELAHHMKNLPTQIGVDFVFFDGEEYIQEKGDKYFFGSEHFARDYQKNPPRYKYIAAILLDMIAGKNARFPKEPNSFFLAGNLVEDIWQIAHEQKCTAFLQQHGDVAVEDDHLALNRHGIPAINIIDFSYEHWHKLSDTPENCSGESMKQVARVITTWLRQVK